jgi:rRNA small subunit pseudouridine methyltransferase Nep1
VRGAVLTLVLADAELELVPEGIKGHPSVQASAQRRNVRAGRTILDSSAHHAAMRGLEDGERRGRPDIVHLFLLTALDSVLNLEGGLRVVVHTRNDERLSIAPETRIMRSYDRFLGLLEQVFREGQAGPRGMDPLLKLEPKVPLAEVLKRVGAERVVAFETPDQGAAQVDLAQALPPLAQAHGHVAVVIGGFPKGAYRSPVQELAQEQWSITPRTLSVWTAASEVLVHWAHATKGMEQHRGPPPQRPQE